VLYLNGFELGPGFNWSTVYIYDMMFSYVENDPSKASAAEDAPVDCGTK